MLEEIVLKKKMKSFKKFALEVSTKHLLGPKIESSMHGNYKMWRQIQIFIGSLKIILQKKIIVNHIRNQSRR